MPPAWVPLAGSSTGTLASDGQHFTITGYEDLTFDGSPVNISITVLSSFDSYFGFGKGYNGNGTPVVTLNGSYMDIMVTTTGAADGFILEHNDKHYGAKGEVASGPSFGNDPGENFNVADWQASLVPEPASLWVLIVAAPLLACVRRLMPPGGGFRIEAARTATRRDCGMSPRPIAD